VLLRFSSASSRQGAHSHSSCSEASNCRPTSTPNTRCFLHPASSCRRCPPPPRSASTAAEHLPHHMQVLKDFTHHSRPMMSGFSVCHTPPRLPHGSHEIGVAEILAKSITFLDLDDEYFTPSCGIDEEFAYDYEYKSEEEYTVLSTWCIIKRASLPIDTFCLASLILKELGLRFYRQWSIGMHSLYRGSRSDRTRELIIIAACVCSLNGAVHVLTFR